MVLPLFLSRSSIYKLCLLYFLSHLLKCYVITSYSESFSNNYLFDLPVTKPYQRGGTQIANFIQCPVTACLMAFILHYNISSTKADATFVWCHLYSQDPTQCWGRQYLCQLMLSKYLISECSLAANILRIRKETKINTQLRDKSSYFGATENQIKDVMPYISIYQSYLIFNHFLFLIFTETL